MRFLTLALLSFVTWSSCTPDNVTDDSSLKKYFEENKVTGCFGLYNNAQSQFTIYNLKRFSDSAYLPASTFKIVNSLIGLESGVVKDDSTIIKWDSIVRGRSECEKDLTMAKAFELSCVPWYRELARRIGQPTMQHYLDTLQYAAKFGRFVINNDLDSFWLNNHALVTADQNLGLVKKLYFDKLPFQKRTQQIVRRMMIRESNANYTLAYKTGWGTTPQGTQLGWIIGWIEENKHPYFFSLQVESTDANINMPAVRMNILKGILKQYDFFEGRK